MRVASRVGWLVGLVGYALALAARPLSEFDLPWHLAWGRVLVATRGVPRVDPIAYTASAVRYIGVLADVFLYGVERLAGDRGLQALGGAIGVALAAALLIASRRASRGALLAVPVALAGVSPWICARPAAMTFVLTACVLGLIDAHRSAAETRRGRAALVGAALLHAVWCNIHGGALVGVALLGAYAAHRVLASRARDRLGALAPRADGGDAAIAVSCAIAALACTMLNPWSIGYWRGPIDLAKVAPFLLEWQWTSPAFFGHEPLVGGSLALLVVAIVAGHFVRTRAPLTAFDLAVIAIAIFAVTRVRFVPLAIVLLAPIAARRLEPLCEARATRLLGHGLVLAMGLVVFVHDGGEIVSGWRRDAFPEAAVRFIETTKPRGHMWNFWPYGGYLGWRLGPAYPVFIDGRIGFVHETDTVLAALAAEQDPRAAHALIETYAMEWAVCRARGVEASCVPLADDPAWTMIYMDAIAAIYVRTAGPNADLAAHGYRLVRHTTPAGDLLAAAVARSVAPSDLVADAALALDQSPDGMRAWFIAGCAAVAMRDSARVENAASHVARGEPSDVALELASALRRAIASATR